MFSIHDIIDALRNAEQIDFEGDRTYRVHMSTAEKLIWEAYRLGKAENNGTAASWITSKKK